MAVMVIRIVRCSGMFMMLVMLGTKDSIGVEDEESGTDFPDQVIELRITGGYRPVHGVMSSDKQAREQMSLNDDSQIGPGRSPAPVS